MSMDGGGPIYAKSGYLHQAQIGAAFILWARVRLAAQSISVVLHQESAIPETGKQSKVMSVGQVEGMNG
jgi:hypothetical protein